MHDLGTLLAARKKLSEIISPRHHDEVAEELRESDIDSVVKQICSSRWRRSAIDPRSSEDLRGKVTNSFTAGVPVKFSIPFGGYKGRSLRFHPHVDWAEPFCLSYLSAYMESVASLVEGGVDAYFTYCTGVMDTVSNLPQSRQDVYLSEFDRLLSHFSSSRVRLRLLDIASLYSSRDALNRELSSNFEAISDRWSSDSNRDNREKRLASARRNFVLDGVTDYSGASPAEIETLFDESARWCEALDSLHERRAFNKYTDKIQLVFVRGPELSLHIGSCETSANHFWASTGVLESSPRGGMRTRILSAQSLSSSIASGTRATGIDSSHWAEELGIETLSECMVVGGYREQSFVPGSGEAH